MEKIYTPIANVVVAVILTLGALHGTGTLLPNHTYATVNYDGGYKKIGVISSENVFTEVLIELEGRQVLNGDLEDALKWIAENSGENEQERKSITYKTGLTVTASAGVSWVGSESPFKLSTESVNLKSTNAKPLTPDSISDSLQAMFNKAKAERTLNSEQALSYGPAPSQSFLLSKLIAAIAN